MTGFDPAAVSVYPGPDGGFVDPWATGSVCGECGTGLAGVCCPGCGQRADADDGTAVLDPGLVGLLASEDPTYPGGRGVVS